MVISGGCACPGDVVEAVAHGADAVAVASVLHYGKFSVADLKCNS